MAASFVTPRRRDQPRRLDVENVEGEFNMSVCPGRLQLPPGIAEQDDVHLLRDPSSATARPKPVEVPVTTITVRGIA